MVCHFLTRRGESSLLRGDQKKKSSTDGENPNQNDLTFTSNQFRKKHLFKIGLDWLLLEIESALFTIDTNAIREFCSLLKITKGFDTFPTTSQNVLACCCL